MKKIIKIDGVHCNGCSSKINAALGNLPETKNVKVDIETQTVELELSKDVDNALLTDLIENAGHFLVVEIN